jgi:hypothetical protein
MREAIFPDEKNTCSLLQAWQAGGAPDDFHQLWKGIKSMVESTVRKTLCRQGIRDPSAADEAISLVMGHLLRLPSGGVAKFDGNQSATGYLFWLSSRRCRDVTRSLRRRREVSLSEVETRIAEPLVESHFDCSTTGDPETAGTATGGGHQPPNFKTPLIAADFVAATQQITQQQPPTLRRDHEHGVTTLPFSRCEKPIPEEGLEPTRPCGQRILSPSRLPFRHSGW